MMGSIEKKIELTDTSRFLLPCFGLSYKKYEEVGFINCFLSDRNREKVNEKDIHLYLLFKPNGDTQTSRLNQMIKDFEEQDRDHLILLEDYDYAGGYVVLVFKFPEKYRSDYDLFLEGKYSHFSDEFKDHFPQDKEKEFGENETLKGKSLQWMVINKSARLKQKQEKKYGISLDDAPEYWHKIIMENEILNIDKLF